MDINCDSLCSHEIVHLLMQELKIMIGRLSKAVEKYLLVARTF